MLEFPDRQDNPWSALSINNAWKSLPSILWSAQAPEVSPVDNLIDISPMALRLLQLDVQQLRTHVDGVATLRDLHAGSRLLPGMSPLAQKYAGHRHGVFNDNIGDGRSLLLGEVATPLGRMEMYLKGGGRTPYALRGDGYLGLRSAIREYLVGHALYGIGIPTSLPLSLCKHKRKIIRGQLEPSATMLRLSPSHVRVGHFEWLASRGNVAGIKSLIAHLGGCYGEGGAMDEELFFQHCVQRTAHLVAAWQVWGFIHGALDTDNIAVLGTTLDHETGSFIESYHHYSKMIKYDANGRYPFSAQPAFMKIGLESLAESLLPLLDERRLGDVLDGYDKQLENAWLCGMRSRLGLMMSREEDAQLIEQWLDVLHHHQSDYTRSFRALMTWSDTPSSDDALADSLGVSRDDAKLVSWLNRYRRRLGCECFTASERYRFMAGVNPLTVLREEDVSNVTEAAQSGDFMPLVRLRKRVTEPFHNFGECNG